MNQLIPYALLDEIIGGGLKELLRNRTLILTGVGRSGTTILGKIIGSMNPVFYLFEPGIMKFLPHFGVSEIFTKILFEDYLCPLVQGRGNMNPLDWSYTGHHEDIEDTVRRRAKLRRRSDAIEYIEWFKPLWVIKNPEFQHLMDYANAFLPGVRYIHLLRNGLDVLRSSLERGWYTNDWCNYDIVEQTYPGDGVRVPYYIYRPEDRAKWTEWNRETRIACAWCSLTELGAKYKKENPERVIQFRYEDICKNPKGYAKALAVKLGLELTDLTNDHIQSVLDHEPRKDNADELASILVSIEPDQRERFKGINAKIGWVV